MIVAMAGMKVKWLDVLNIFQQTLPKPALTMAIILPAATPSTDVFQNRRNVIFEGKQAPFLVLFSRLVLPGFLLFEFFRDCEGGEDESDCPDGQHCPGEMFHCSRTAAAATPSDVIHNNFFDNCIEMARHCNGIVDCPNGEDEMECYSHDNHHIDQKGDQHEEEVHGDAMKIDNNGQQLILPNCLLLFIVLPALIELF